MRTSLLLSLAVSALLLGSAGFAGERMPPLLCDAETLKAPTVTVSAACPPAACPSEPVCAPAAPSPVCAAPAPVQPVCAAPAPRTRAVTTVVNEAVTVPVRRKVVDEECYTTTEKRTEVVDEIRTRTATRKVPIVVTKEVKDAIYVKTQSPTGKQPRLARTVQRRVVPKTKYVNEEFEKTVTVPVKQTVEVPVVKTRKVTRYVDEYQVVNRPRKVTTYEAR